MTDLDAIRRERGKVYGPPDENWRGIAMMFAPLLQPHADAIKRGEPLPIHVMALLMVAIKLNRMRLVYLPDNYDDAMNYLRFAQEWQQETGETPSERVG